jgi:hypothetical protein
LAHKLKLLTMKIIAQQTHYDQAALEAREASANATQLNTIEAHKKAASAQFAARIQAWGVGNESAFKEHDRLGNAHFSEIHKLQAHKTAQEHDEAAEHELAAGGTVEHDGKTLTVTQKHFDLGKDARNQVEGGHNPASWVEDEGKWEKAKEAALKSYDEGDDAYWPVVTTIYENMGGGIKSSASARNARTNDALQAQAVRRMSDDKELMASVKDGGHSFSDLQSNIQSKVSANTMLCPNSGGICCCWVADVIAPEHETGEEWEAIVQGQNGRLFCVRFTIDDDDEVTLVGDPKEVERTTDYEYIFEPSTPETTMAKKALTKSLTLQAGRSEDRLKKNYDGAAETAHNASAEVAEHHEICASHHRIAAEHARMADMPVHAAMHAGHAASHDAMVCSHKAVHGGSDHALAAKSHGTAHEQLTAAHGMMAGKAEHADHLPMMQAKANFHKLMASAHQLHAEGMYGKNANGSSALEAGGPGSGPRPGGGMRRTKPAKMRPFKEHDWDAFAGAESPEGGHPMIGEHTMPDGKHIVSVADKNGISVGVSDKDDEDLINERNYTMDVPFESAKHLAEHALNAPSEEHLLKMGFKKI